MANTQATKRPDKAVYFFSAGDTDGNAKMKETLGGKGANLAEMTSLGIPVPPGFTISTEICALYYESGKQIPEWLKKDIEAALAKVEQKVGKKFGDVNNPLLFSVRSGARASMPGMMDTILNLGLNDQTVAGLSKKSNNPRFAWDSYRRFIQMYSDVVMEMDHDQLEKALERVKHDKGYKLDSELKLEDLQGLVKKYKDLVKEYTKKDFPNDPKEQLWGAISAVFGSWMNNRAIEYRRLNNIPAEWGTAVNVQSMVFGNMGDDSATGVAFTRDPSTGKKMFYGEFLVNAQGEDVVAGIRTPQPVTKEEAALKGVKSLEELMPKAYKELSDIYHKLEHHYRDMQDIEFTIEQGTLWMLQTRNGKRTAPAALKIAMDMLGEGLINEEEAVLRIDPSSLDQLLHPTLDPKAPKTLIAKGLPASPGAASGKIVFHSEEAVEYKEKGIKTILVREETSPEDITGMVSAQGILTTRGGMTSHAAVVARGMGKCCIVGCGEIHVDYDKQIMTSKGKTWKKGDVITLNGGTGEIFDGEIKTVTPELGGTFHQIMEIADKYRKLKIRTNADTPKDSEQARKFGAEGIGLCRTEHMFFDPDRIDIMREMIMATNTPDREKALARLLPFQREDFIGIFKAMKGYPVTIRLLDPPLHEFIPQSEEDQKDYCARTGFKLEQVRHVADSLHEFNPMLGHRGCRLGVTYPEIYRMQARAIAEAAAEIAKSGEKIIPEIMIPLIAVDDELRRLRELCIEEVEKVQKEKNVKYDYLVGTMIEIPRAALTADHVVKYADFFSFGTNDLTQMTFGLSRDDSSKFLAPYVAMNVLKQDPFMSLDQNGVGILVETATKLGRKVKPTLKVGVCGEHGGDPDSIGFFHKVGLDYVSCSPFRVPIARLAAARAAILEKKNK